MKLATSRYDVVIKGTKCVVDYYGFRTRKEAERVRSAFERATGKEYEVRDNKKLKKC